jgi:FtsP/CotA-like multicopper oxidase with cupredoxin domain
MFRIGKAEINRRTFLGGAAGSLAAPMMPSTARCADATRDVELSAAADRWPLAGAQHPATAVWCYGGRVPGPEIRLRQGQPARIVVHNRLPEETTVHWHGVRLPNAMDGVPGLTQPSIKPGTEFIYAFTPPDAGTFWYHPHANSLEQLGRGLAGALIVEESEPVAVDRDVLWVLADWRLTSDAQIAAGFGNMMEAGMSGRVGNTVTLNGRMSNAEPVRAGERVRLRLVNTAPARIMALRFEGHRPVVVATDGQPCEPHEPENRKVMLGPAMRVDLVLDMQGEPARRYRVIDDFYDGLAYWLTELVYDTAPPLRTHPLEAPLTLPRNPLPEPDLASAHRHEITLEGGMMSQMGMTGGMGGMRMPGMSQGAMWAINGMSMTGDGAADMPPMLTLERGRSCLMVLRNDTAWWHPMHLHGHSFRVLRRNGVSVPHPHWADTVLLPPRENVEIAFVADNPGDWMLHCHVLDHQMAGMMTVLRVA